MYTLAVPVRLHIAPDASFAALCQRCRRRTGWRRHTRGYGLSEIMGDLSRTAWRARCRTLLYPTKLYPAAARASRAVRDALRRRYDQPAHPARPDWSGMGDYQFRLDYRASYYTPHEITDRANAARHSRSRHGGLHPCPCRSIELLTDEDKFCQRALLSGPVLPVDPNDTIITRFRAQAALHPDRRALSGKGPSYTFRELDEASDRVARNLIAAGVQPQSYVAFLLPRTTALPVMLLGIPSGGRGLCADRLLPGRTHPRYPVGQ